MKKCEVCEKERPDYMMSEVQIFSREYVGLVSVCDFCLVDVSGKRLRKYTGFSGWVRKKLVELWEKKHPDEWLTCCCASDFDDNVTHHEGCPAYNNN